MFEHARARQRAISILAGITTAMAVPVVGATEAAALPAATIRTIAGQASSPGNSGDGGPAQFAQLNAPGALAEASGEVFVADRYNRRVRKIDAAGSMSTAHDLGVAACPTGLSHNGAALLVVDGCTHRITRVVGTVATHVAGTGTPAYSPDGAPAATSPLNHPMDAVEGANGIYVSEWPGDEGRVRLITPVGDLTTVYTGGCPTGLASDVSGNVYVADPCYSVVRKITPSGSSSVVAGMHSDIGYSGDGGPATSARIGGPSDVATDPSGNLYIAEGYNRRIRRVSPDGTIDTVAGNGQPGVSGDGGPALLAAIGSPQGVSIGPTGTLYLSDIENHVVRAVNVEYATVTAAVQQTGFASDGCAAGTVVAAGTAKGTTARVSLVQPAPGEASVCVRVDGDGIRAGGRFDVSAEEIELLGVDNDATACTTTPGNTVPGPHPLAGADIGDPNDPQFVATRIDSYADDDDVWVCLLAGDLAYRVRMRGAVDRGPEVVFVADPPGAAHGTDIGAPALNPSGSCQATGGERIVDVDVEGSRTFAYVKPSGPGVDVCVATSGIANVGGVLRVDYGGVGSISPVRTQTNGLSHPCTAQVVHVVTPEVTIRRTAPGAIPAAICIELAGQTVDVIVEPGSTSVPVTVTWTPDPGTPGLP